MCINFFGARHCVQFLQQMFMFRGKYTFKDGIKFPVQGDFCTDEIAMVNAPIHILES